MNWDKFWNFLRELVNPFELLYMSIAIATLGHTIWGSAYLFEGGTPTADTTVMWHFNGLLIAVAVDLGMLLTSRFLQSSTGRMQTGVLVASFLIAAIVSFYFQMVYILWHTPTFVISDGVDPYWVNHLTPILAARVILLPLALPVLASVYTLARIFNRHQVKAAQVLQPARVQGVSDLVKLIQLAERTPENLGAGDGAAALPEASMNLKNRTFYYDRTAKNYGPYKSRGSMILAMKRVRDLNEKEGSAVLVIERPDPSDEVEVD